MDNSTHVAWKRVTSVVAGALFITPILVSVMVSGCAGLGSTLTGGAAVAFSNAQRTEEKLQGISSENSGNRRAERAETTFFYKENTTNRRAERAENFFRGVFATIIKN